MNYLDIFQYIFMAVVCIGGVIAMIKVVKSEKKD